MRYGLSVRLLLVVPALLFAIACGGGSDTKKEVPANPSAPSASGATSAAPAQASAAAQGRLLVADVTGEVIYVYDVAEMKKVAEFPSMKLSLHLGAMALPDGRAVFVDDKNGEVVVLQALGDKPTIVAKTKAKTPAIWGAVDPGLNYLVYSNAMDKATQVAVATVLDLKDYKTYELPVNLKGDGELHVALAGSPPMLYATTVNEVHAYAVADIVKGNAKSLGYTEVNPSLHGLVVTHSTPPRIGVSAIKSFDITDYAGSNLKPIKSVSWDADGRSGGRNGRPRLSADGNFVYGAIAAAVPAEAWQTRQNDIHIVDLKQDRSKRLALAPGVVGRFQLSAAYGLFYNMHPDGDFAYLFDTNPASKTFQTVVARIPLAPLSNAPKAGQDAVAFEARGGAILPDGRLAFVSHGGDGKVSVIDTEKRAVISQISLPTPLKGGGYLLALQKDARVFDTEVR
jgi:YVTN family beta-propeller protein